jgi:hypothetical protein
VADIEHRTLTSAPEPVLAAHVATKNYVDVVRNDWSIVALTGSATLIVSDRGKVVAVDSSSATTITVPLNSSVGFPLHTVIRVRKMGTGNVTVAGAGGVTINWAGAFVISTRYTMAEIQKLGTDLWVGMLIGA